MAKKSKNKAVTIEAKIKGLTSQISKLKTERAIAETNMGLMKKEISRCTIAINNLTNQKNQLLKKGEGITISEHAIVRYLERIEGVDIEAIKKKIKTQGFEKLFEELPGNGEYPSGTGFQIVVRHRNIVTIKD